MKQKYARFGMLLLSVIWVGANLLLGAQYVMASSPAQVFSSIRATQFVTATPTPTPPSGFSLDPAIIAAIIGAVAVVVAAIIGGGFIVYQVKKNHKLEIEKLHQQSQSELALERQRHEAELQKMRYGERLSAEREEQERERQRRAAANSSTLTAASESAKAAMRLARTPAERDKIYREAIHADANISQLQILDMSQPLEVTKVYVRVRLHQETRLGYELEPALLSAESQRDPNALLKAGRVLLETRSSAAMSPEDALQKHRRCIVLGDPGAGKSTLLKYLTLKSVDKQLPNLPDLPIHIALGEFASSDKQDLIEFAVARWNERYGFPENEARAFIEEHLAEGRALLLLDALDETVIGESEEIASESYRRVLIAIDQVATRFQKAPMTPIVVTARKAGYHQRAHLNGFTELEVLDFRLEEIQQFINNWFACYTTPRRYATADDLNARLERNPRLQSLAANPLLLCLIVMVYELQQDLPEKRAELYKQCTDTLLFRWDTSRDIRRRHEFKTEYKRQLLAEIAWHFHRQGRRYFPEDELLTLIAEFLPTVGLSQEQNRPILREIEEEIGLLKEQAHGWHGFLHLTLQEYFVAQYVSENDKLDELLRFRGDPWWEEVLSLYASYTSDASSLLQKLLAQEKRQLLWKDVYHTPLLWAGRCLAARPRIKQTTLREEVIARLFELLRKTPFSLTRQRAARTLAEIGGNEVMVRLLTVLKDKQDDSDVRRSAAEALGQLGERSVVSDLLATLKDKQDDSFVRRSAALALGQLGERSVAPSIIRSITSSDYRIGDEVAVLKELTRDYTTIRAVASLLRRPSIANETHRILWDISQREKVRISMIDWRVIKLVKVSKW